MRRQCVDSAQTVHKPRIKRRLCKGSSIVYSISVLPTIDQILLSDEKTSVEGPEPPKSQKRVGRPRIDLRSSEYRFEFGSPLSKRATQDYPGTGHGAVWSRVERKFVIAEIIVSTIDTLMCSTG